MRRWNRLFLATALMVGAVSAKGQTDRVKTPSCDTTSDKSFVLSEELSGFINTKGLSFSEPNVNYSVGYADHISLVKRLVLQKAAVHHDTAYDVVYEERYINADSSFEEAVLSIFSYDIKDKKAVPRQMYQLECAPTFFASWYTIHERLGYAGSDPDLSFRSIPVTWFPAKKDMVEKMEQALQLARSAPETLLRFKTNQAVLGCDPDYRARRVLLPE